MTRAPWRNKKNTRTPTKAFDVSDVRRIPVETLLHQLATPADEAPTRDSRPTITSR